MTDHPIYTDLARVHMRLSNGRKETLKRVRFASGYTELGMLNEASDELEAIESEDRFLPEVLAARVELHVTAKHWETVVGVARELTFRAPSNPSGWISWAYALRELNRIAESKAVLLEAEQAGVSCAVLHYNMACYHSLLGETEEAKKRLNRACSMDERFKTEALDDPDLEALWAEFGKT